MRDSGRPALTEEQLLAIVTPKVRSNRNSTEKTKLKERLYNKSNRCCFCRAVLTFATATIEHVTPRSQGGGWEIENLRLSCQECNWDRGSRDFEEYRTARRAKHKCGSM